MIRREYGTVRNRLPCPSIENERGKPKIGTPLEIVKLMPLRIFSMASVTMSGATPVLTMMKPLRRPRQIPMMRIMADA